MLLFAKVCPTEAHRLCGHDAVISSGVLNREN